MKKWIIICLIAVMMFACKKVEEPELGRVDQWQADLNYLKENLPKKHIHMYHQTAKEEFDQAFDALLLSIPTMSDDEITMAIKEIVTMVGDGHTRLLDPSGVAFLPYFISSYEEGYYLFGGDVSLKSVMGCEIESINDTPVEEIVEALMAYTSADNMTDLKKGAIGQLNNLSALSALGYVDDTRTARLKTSDSVEISVSPIQLSELQFHSMIDDHDAAKEMLSIAHRDAAYYLEAEPATATLYLQYNRCMEDEHYAMDDLKKDLSQYMDDQPYKVLVDMRYNGGGDSEILEPVIQILEEAKKASRIEEVFVAIGSSTYSSAILNTLQLRQACDAILIGSSTGGSPNHYGEVKVLELPYSHLQISYATKYFKVTDEFEDTIIPDVLLPRSITSTLKGVDPVLDYVREYK